MRQEPIACQASYFNDYPKLGIWPDGYSGFDPDPLLVPPAGH